MERLLRPEGDGAEKFEKPTPFKVYFVDKPILGKSDIKTKKLPGNEKLIFRYLIDEISIAF